MKQNATNTNYRFFFTKSISFLLLLLLIICSPLLSFSSDFFIREVITNGSVTPKRSAEISFFLSVNANINIEIYDPDYTVIRHLGKDRNLPKGTNSFSWDGKDDSGTLVPNEAYYFIITARDTHGNKVVYNSMVDQQAGANLLIDF
ncbi:MAG: hypothetical protein D3918_12270, partial [Candidatus Electrothrix sp. AX2]|nr:hypothetical protein [Candidatus Electrothrix gigas]